jgi:hypothetical protein
MSLKNLDEYAIAIKGQKSNANNANTKWLFIVRCHKKWLSDVRQQYPGKRIFD